MLRVGSLLGIDSRVETLRLSEFIESLVYGKWVEIMFVLGELVESIFL